MYFKKTFPVLCRSVISTLRQYKKEPLILSFPDVATRVSPKLQFPIFSSTSEMVTSNLCKSTLLKNYCLCALRHNPENLKTQIKENGFCFIS